MSEFALRLRALRNRLGMSQKRLDRAAGMADGYVSQCENGYIELPRGRNLGKLAAALDVSPAVLAGKAPMPEKILNEILARPQPPPTGVAIDPTLRAAMEAHGVEIMPQPEPAPAHPPQPAGIPSKPTEIQTIQKIFVRCWGPNFINETPYPIAAQLAASAHYNREVKSGKWCKVQLEVVAVMVG